MISVKAFPQGLIFLSLLINRQKQLYNNFISIKTISKTHTMPISVVLKTTIDIK